MSIGTSYCGKNSRKPLGRITRIPIHLARHIHDHGEDDEEGNRAHEQRIILLAQGDVEEGVNARKTSPNHEGANAATEEVLAIPGNEQSGGSPGDQVGRPETDELGDGEEHQVEKTQRRANHQVLEWMNLLSRGDFEKEKCREDEDEKENAIFDGAFDVAVGVKNREKF